MQDLNNFRRYRHFNTEFLCQLQDRLAALKCLAGLVSYCNCFFDGETSAEVLAKCAIPGKR